MSYQSTLGEGVAEELAESQREISIAEFFEKNKHMLGFDSGARGLVTAVKEAVDNALDAAEEAGILPDIYVEITQEGDYYRLVVEDNGPGITKEQLPRVFGKLLYGSRFHAREQNRGQQGIGISAAVLYSQLTSGKPAKITSRTQGSSEAQYFELIIDTDSNEPEISEDRTVSWDRSHGTRIELEMEANMRARGQLHDYIEHTAIVNPHARIELREPGVEEPIKFDRVEDAGLPEETEEIRPHPHGVQLGTLLKMLSGTDSYSLSGFLQEEFTRVGSKTADDILAAFRDRHFGREAAWSPPERGADVDVAGAVVEVVSNKPPDATTTYAERAAAELREREAVTRTDLEALVADVADAVSAETGTTFGATVRDRTVARLWEVVTADRRSDLHRLVDEATTTQKDDRTVDGVAERLAATYDADERDRLTRAALAERVDRAADLTEEHDDATLGDTARENITGTIWEAMATVEEEVPPVREVAESRNVASDFLDAMAATDIISPPTTCLSPITPDLIEAGLRKEVDADFYAAATRDAEVHGGDPFVVEAGIAYGGDLQTDGPIELMRFANRVPLVYQRGACATTDAVKAIGWRNYGLDQAGGSGMPSGPCAVLVHVASTNVPFTSESKDAIANVPELEDEIELAIREAARDLKSYLKKRRSLQKRRKKQSVLADILPEMATKLGDVTDRDQPNIDDALARIMNNLRIERAAENGSVNLVVENHTGTNETPEITDIVSAEPANVSDGASVVEMDGEWFVRWSPTVGSGEEAVLEYDLDGDASSDLDVSGVETEKLTVSTQ